MSQATISLRVVKAQAKFLHNTLAKSQGSLALDPLDLVSQLNDLAIKTPQPSELVTEHRRAVRIGSGLTGEWALGTVVKKNFWNKDQTAWVTRDGYGQSMVVFGSPGCGKTETLLTLANRAHNEGLGVLYVDSFGDNTVYHKVGSLLSQRGRENELRVINLLGGGGADQTHRLDLIGGMDGEALLSWCRGVIVPALDITPQKIGAECAEELLKLLSVAVVEGAKKGLWGQHVNTLFEAMSFEGLQQMCDKALSNSTRAPLQAFLEQTQATSQRQHLVGDILEQCRVALGVLVQGTRAFGESPNVNLEQSLQAGHFVLVLMQATEKSNTDMMIVGSAISQTLLYAQSRQDLKRPHTCVFSDLPNAVPAPNGQALWDAQNPNAFLVWGALDYSLVKLKNMTPLLDRTNIKVFMKNDDVETTTFFGRDTTHPVLGKSLRDQREGEAYVVEKSDFFTMVMGYDHTNPWHGELIDLPPIAVQAGRRAFLKYRIPSLDKQVKVLQQRLDACKDPSEVTLSWCLETVAKMMGFAHWHEATKQLR